jgi:hypothetical protein
MYLACNKHLFLCTCLTQPELCKRTQLRLMLWGRYCRLERQLLSKTTIRPAWIKLRYSVRMANLSGLPPVDVTPPAHRNLDPNSPLDTSLFRKDIAIIAAKIRAEQTSEFLKARELHGFNHSYPIPIRAQECLQHFVRHSSDS